MHFILQWIDLIWLPLGLAAAHKGQRIFVLTYVLLSIVMLRLLTDMALSMNYSYGLLKTPLFERGLIVFSLFTMAYLIFAHYSKRRDPWIFFGTTMTIFVIASSICLVVMLL